MVSSIPIGSRQNVNPAVVITGARVFRSLYALRVQKDQMNECARLQPKLIYIAKCPISRMPTFLMGGLYLARWIFARAISKMLRKIWMLIGFG